MSGNEVILSFFLSFFLLAGLFNKSKRGFEGIFILYIDTSNEWLKNISIHSLLQMLRLNHRLTFWYFFFFWCNQLHLFLQEEVAE